MPTMPQQSPAIWTVEMWSYRTGKKLSTLAFPNEGKARYVTARGIRKFARCVPRAVLKRPDGSVDSVLVASSGAFVWVDAATYRRFEHSHQFCMPQEAPAADGRDVALSGIASAAACCGRDAPSPHNLETSMCQNDDRSIADGAPDNGPDLAAFVIAEMRHAAALKRGFVTRLATSQFFTFELDGDDLVFTDDLRARVEALLGEPCREVTYRGLEGETALVPASLAS